MRLKLGARLSCTDGESCRLVDVVVDPATRTVTHLVVEPRRDRGTARLVPAELAQAGNEKSRPVELRVTAEELRRLPPVNQVSDLRLRALPVDDPEWDVGVVREALDLPDYPAHDPRTDVARLSAGVEPSRGEGEPRLVDFALAYDRIPKRELEFRRASSVTSADGHRLGHVDGFIVDRDRRITHLVVERGRLWGRRELAIPVEAVAGAATDAVVLELTKDQVGALREGPPPPPRPARRLGLVAALLPHPRVTVGLGSANLAGAVYGTIVAMAIVLGLDKASASPGRALWILVGSGIFFWAAHVYSELLAHRLQGHHPMTRAEIVGVMRREWPLFQATFPLAVPLALGALGVISGPAARYLAAFVGVATLAAWGAAIARREGCRGAVVLGAAAANAAVGLSLVALKVALG